MRATNKKRSAVPYRKIQITGKRLELRPYKFSDFRKLQLSQQARLPINDKYDESIPTAKESDYEKHKERLRRHRVHGKEGHHFIFGAFDKKTGDYIGQIDIFTINKQLRWANIGYHIQNQHFGNGYASEAARLGLRIAFNLLGFHRIEAAMELDNTASQRVAIKIGLRFEGVRKKFFPDNGGIDMNVYSNNAIDYR